MTTETMHEVKSAAAVLADDVICQSFIQSSSTLAYACLLIRRKQYDLAVHVLHSLEAKQASRFKDMVFYLQAQIGIETGEFAMAKKRLVPRVHQHPNDMVALSLLEGSIYHEWLEWAKGRPAVEPASSPENSPAAPLDAPPMVSGSLFGNQQAAAMAAAAALAAAAESSAYPVAYGEVSEDQGHQPPSGAIPASHLRTAVDPLSEANDRPLSGLLEARPAFPPASKPVSFPSQPAVVSRSLPPAQPVAAGASGARPLFVAPAPGADGDVGIYQTLANDQNTHAILVWNAETGTLKSSCRNPQLETLAGFLPNEVPASIQAACSSLDGGSIHKVCFSFHSLTVTTFHSGAENMGLITGHINQSLLTIVRAENTFRKQAAALAQAGRPAEYAPHE